MKAAYDGQRELPNTDHKFRPQDKHLLEKNKEELDHSEHGDRMKPLPGQEHDKFVDIDKKKEEE